MAIFLVPSASSQARSQLFDDLLARGTHLSQSADYAHAIPLLEEARKLAPRDYAVNLLLGMDLLRSGYSTDALAPLHIAADVRPDDATAEGYLGEAATAANNFALAAEAFQAAVQRSPKSEEALLSWADYGLERFRVLDLWLRGSPRGTAARLRVEAEATADGTKAREELLRQSAAADPAQLGIWGELGVAQIQLGKQAEAEATLKIARERQPGASATWQLEALVEAARGNWPRAEARLLAIADRSMKTLQRDLIAWPSELMPDGSVPGRVWQCLRDQSAQCSLNRAARKPTAMGARQLFAEERWEQLAAAPPPAAGQSLAWFQRGVALGQIGDCPRAIPALEHGLKPGAEAAGFWLEVCYGAGSDRAAARLSAQGKDAAVHELRGDMLLRLKGDPAAAQAEYSTAVHLKPRDPDLLERLAQTSLALGDTKGARQAAQAAVAVDPHRKLALRLLATAAMSESNYPDALAALNQLAAMDPRDGWTQAHLGISYALSGRSEEAARSLSSAFAAGYPDEKGALHALLAASLRKLGREQEARNAAAEANRLAKAFKAHTDTNSKEPR